MTSTIIIRTDSKLKARAQKTAAELGLTLSTVINNHLKKFVEEKSFKSTRSSDFWKKHKTPFGIFKDAKTTDKDINEVTHSWDKIVDKLT